MLLLGGEFLLGDILFNRRGERRIVLVGLQNRRRHRRPRLRLGGRLGNRLGNRFGDLGLVKANGSGLVAGWNRRLRRRVEHRRSGDFRFARHPGRRVDLIDVSGGMLRLGHCRLCHCRLGEFGGVGVNSQRR